MSTQEAVTPRGIYPSSALIGTHGYHWLSHESAGHPVIAEWLRDEWHFVHLGRRTPSMAYMEGWKYVEPVRQPRELPNEQLPSRVFRHGQATPLVVVRSMKLKDDPDIARLREKNETFAATYGDAYSYDAHDLWSYAMRPFATMGRAIMGWFRR